MSSAIQNILERTIGDGARSSKYEVLFDFTNNASAPPAEDTMVMCKTTQYPTKSHQTIDFKYKGRTIPLKGQVKYNQTWECTFYLTQDHRLKAAFENWIEALDQKHNYIKKIDEQPWLLDTQHSHLSGYTRTINLYQMDFNGEEQTSKYTLYNVFPVEISPIQASSETTGEVLEFTVTFAFSYFTMEVMKGKDGNFVDTLVGKITDKAQSLIGGLAGNLADSINSFVTDAIGDTLNKLNDLASGIATDVAPQLTDTKVDAVFGGGLGIENMATTIDDAVEVAQTTVLDTLRV